jgi:hypothetical protein
MIPIPREIMTMPRAIATCQASRIKNLALEINGCR